MVGPWGTGDPVQWAVDTGRLLPKSAAAWQSDYRRDPAGIGQTLASLSPVLVDTYPEQYSERVVASARASMHQPRSRSGSDGPYAVNPLSNGLRPRPVMASAGSAAPAPTLFESGDIPLIIVLGLPPERLLDLPWQARPPVAAERDPGEALELFEEL